MKTRSFLALLAATGLVTPGCVKQRFRERSVTVLSYSSLASQGGFLKTVAEPFRAESGCELKVETTLGATQMEALLKEPKTRGGIDVVMGLDEPTFARVMRYLSPEDFSSLGLSKRILPELSKHVHPGWIPLDYSALSFVYRIADFPQTKALPKSRRDLLGSALRKKFIVQDPRASSPGQLFFLFLQGSVGIRELRDRWLTLAPSWDSSYQMFLAGEAPMVWTYLTSLAYHASKGERDRLGYVDFEEGLPIQVEGMAVVQRKEPSPRNPCVDSWIRYVLKPENLALLAQKQWMFPVYQSVTIPPFFQHVPAVRRIFELESDARVVDAQMKSFELELFGAPR
jgi:thiamine transport system substrate-binding protein